ncbi:MAG: PD40 domain-containing protein, partial [Planctomycetes bacterium]|nr:PD40 domain-containing protein [Planctomycetota bacterium]
MTMSRARLAVLIGFAAILSIVCLAGCDNTNTNENANTNTNTNSNTNDNGNNNENAEGQCDSSVACSEDADCDDGDTCTIDECLDGCCAISFVDCDNDVVITCQLDLNEPLQVSTSGAFPDWSPDGSAIAFSDPGIHVYNPCDGTRQMIRSTGLWPAWSPSGEKIAFYEDGDLYVMDATGGNLQRLGAGGVSIEWSPDGSKILCGNDNARPSNYLRLTNLHTGDQTKIYFTNRDGETGDFTWTTTGEIAVKVPRGSTPDWPMNMIKVFDLAGTVVETITLDAYSKPPYDLRFSPDGNMLAHSVGSRGVWVSSADGSDHVQMSERGGALAWSPDGRYLVIDDSSSSNQFNNDIWIIPVRARTLLPPCNETNPTPEEIRQAVFSLIGAFDDPWGDPSDFHGLITAVEDEIGCSLRDGGQAEQRSEQDVQAAECPGEGIFPFYCGPGVGCHVVPVWPYVVCNPLVPSCLNEACCAHDMCYDQCDVGNGLCVWTESTENCDEGLIAICRGDDDICDFYSRLHPGFVTVCALVDWFFCEDLLSLCTPDKISRNLICTEPATDCGECARDDDCDDGETCEAWTCLNEPVCDNDGICEAGEDNSNCQDCPVSGGACDDAPSLQFS